MRILSIIIQFITISFIIYAIQNNDAFAFSLSQELDYSVPFDFSSSYADNNTPGVSNFLDENKDVEAKTNDTYFTDKDDNSDIFIENRNSQVNNNDDRTDLTYNHEMKEDNVLNKLLDEPELTDTSNNPNSLVEVYKNKDETKDVEFKSEIKEKSSQKSVGNGKLAIINFDDSWISQYDNAKPILDEYNFKATFYIVCVYMEGKNRMTWEQIQILQQEGHEIGSHTMNHENLDDISRDARYHEIVDSKKCIEDKGIKVNSFSYPFNSGDDNEETLDLVANNYDFARTAGGGQDGGSDNFGNYEGYERYTIVGWSHDAERKENSYSDLQMLDVFKDYVDQYDDEKSLSVGIIPIIIYHNIDGEKGPYNTSIDLFNSEMKYLFQNGFKVVTMNEVFG